MVAFFLPVCQLLFPKLTRYIQGGKSSKVGVVHFDTCQSGHRIPLFTFCSKLIENAMDFLVAFFGKFRLLFPLSFSVFLGGKMNQVKLK